MTYDPASGSCAGKSQPGARALMAWALDRYPTATNLGIYVCRAVRGGTAKSVHADGRAGDTAFPMPRSGVANPLGRDLAEILVEHAQGLGVQCVIFDNRIWSSIHRSWRVHCGHTGARGPHGSCSGPHLDHVHWEITWHAAANLTVADIERITQEDDMAQWTDEDSDNLRAVREGIDAIRHEIAGPADKNPRLVRIVRAVESLVKPKG